MRLFPLALILLLAWGALAFGGSPTWAAAPTLVLGVVAGVLGFLEARPAVNLASGASNHRAVVFAVALVLASIALQLLPISPGLLQRVSPARTSANFEQLLAVADRRAPERVEQAIDQPKPLSIAASRTQLGLAAVAGLGVLLLGASRGFSLVGTRGLARAIAALGVVVTFVGLYQLTSGAKLVYGWYVPLFTDARSAPFLNPNHQAGWLVMVMSLSLGAFAGEVARGMRGVSPKWRDRIVWLSSKEANVALLLLFASAAMGVGILATRARSGAIAMMLTFVIVAGWNSRRQPTLLRRVAMSAGLIAVAFALLAFNGQAVLEELATTTGPGTRLSIWQDTIRIVSDFSMTGSGFNTYAAAMLHYQSEQGVFRWVEAHNEYLQLAAEGGLLVGIPFLLLAAALTREIWKRFREQVEDTRTYWLRVGAVTGVIAIALQSIVEFTLQMPGGAVMFTTLLAIAIHHPPQRSSQRKRDGR